MGSMTPAGAARDAKGARGADSRRAASPRSQPSSVPVAALGNQAAQAALAVGPARAPRLAIGRPDDPAERDADRIADRVMGGAEPALAISPGPQLLQRECDACAAGEEEPGPLRRKATPGPDAGGAAPPSVHAVLGSPGRPLDPGSLAFFGRRFGRDFSDVRIHDDAQAAASAREVRAQAYTVGRNIAFAQGRRQPQSPAGQRLIAHELAHVVQQDGPATLRRQLAGEVDGGSPVDGGGGAEGASGVSADAGVDASSADAPTTQDAPKEAAPGAIAGKSHNSALRSWPIVGEQLTIGGLELSENYDQLENVAWHLIAEGDKELQIKPGLYAAQALIYRIQPVLDHEEEAGACLESNSDCNRKDIARATIREAYATVAHEVTATASAMLHDFQEAARANALATLKRNEEQANAELIRYSVKFNPPNTSGTGAGSYSDEYQPPYSMDATSPGAAGLQKAAKLLLKRHEAAEEQIDTKRREQMDHVHTVVGPGDSVYSDYTYTDAEYDVLAKDIERITQTYNNARSLLSAMFPVLASFSELEKGTGDLETLANTPPGQEIADLLGDKIDDVLQKIAKSRNGLDPQHDDVNVWTLDPIVGLTKAQLGGDDNPVLKSLVAEKVESEKPGALAAICLAVLNIGALLLAGPTGGISLAVAAGVNIVVTASHVEEYLTQKALAGSAFDKAKALSHEDPSLFWLAFEVIGTAIDVGAAVAAFKTVGPLAKAALAAKEGREAEEALEAVRVAARDAEGAELADKLAQQIKTMRKGGAAAVGELTEETELIAKIGEASNLEAADQIGKALETGAGKISVSKAGHVFSCASPCSELGFKYADILAKDQKLKDGLVAIQESAAESRRLEELGKVAEAEELANQVKQRAADLEKTIKQTYPSAESVLTEAAEAAKLEASTKFTLESTAHEAPKLLDAARVAGAAQKLGGKFPALLRLSDGAIERIARAGLAAAESGGGLRAAKRWLSSVRGQLLEELAAVRVRNLLGTAEGRVAMGLDKEATDLIFVEGSRIRDAEGLQLTDGIIVRRVKDRVEIVAVLESKAGHFASSKLAEGLSGLKRMPAHDLLEGVQEAGLKNAVLKIDPSLAPEMSAAALEKLRETDRAALAAYRERLLAAIDKLPEADLRPLKQVMQHGEGQVSLDIERLLSNEERNVQIQLKDGLKEMTVTAEVPKRPQFLGATPKDVSSADIAAQLEKEGFSFKGLDMGDLNMSKAELDDLAKAIIGELQDDLIAAADDAAKAAVIAP